MIKSFFLVALLFNLSFGCATCMLMTPSVEVETKVHIEENKLTNIHFVWHFSDTYTSEMVNQYDKNRNTKLDKEELDKILEAMLEYLIPKSMVSSIGYTDDNVSESIVLHPIYENFTIKTEDEFLVFSYDARVQREFFDNSSLSIAFEDDESYFAFIMTELSVNDNDFTHTKNLYLFTASVLFSEKSLEGEVAEPQAVAEVEKPLEPEIIKNTQSVEVEVGLQENFLKQSMEKIKSLFESIKDEKNPMSYLFLLFFAYLYGVIHAMGPGHGKTLVASYFLSNERSYSKAFFISLAIGVVHTFSAFILTIVIYYLVNTLLAQFLDDTVFYTTKISALIIISIAVYLIYTKYRLYKQIEEESQMPQFAFSTSPIHISTCACASCKVDKNSTDIALIISAGIIPCPGTTTLFIFAISTGLYYAGFISALVMSLGMSSVIFFSALLSTVIRKKMLSSSDRLKKYLEFTSLALILVLGGVLLFI